MPTALRLERSTWYGWQMLPGYAVPAIEPYFSPILIRAATRGPGSRIWHLEFLNLLYASGVQDFSIEMRVLRRTEHYLVGDLVYEGSSLERTVIISEISFEWLRRCCGDLLVLPPAADGRAVGEYLSALVDGR